MVGQFQMQKSLPTGRQANAKGMSNFKFLEFPFEL
jgi:hypothetical protein